MAIITKDYIGNDCVKEADLDAAFIELGGKGEVVPMTCADIDEPMTFEYLTSLMGREPTQAEWASNYYRNATYQGKTVFVPIDDIVTPVPLPASGVMMGTVVLAAIAIKVFRK